MIDVSQVLELHEETVERWHREAPSNPYPGIYGLICAQHTFNFLLWHEEDIARSKDVDDSRIAAVKRNIDVYNQQRNDAIEKVDDALTSWLSEQGITPAPDAPLNTETVGSVIDRLSILSLRIYHMREQTERTDASPEHLASVRAKLALCLEQREDLSRSLTTLLEDITQGRKRHKTYRQMKMYNDPTLNPYLYRSARGMSDAASSPLGSSSIG